MGVWYRSPDKPKCGKVFTPNICKERERERSSVLELQHVQRMQTYANVCKLCMGSGWFLKTPETRRSQETPVFCACSFRFRLRTCTKHLPRTSEKRPATSGHRGRKKKTSTLADHGKCRCRSIICIRWLTVQHSIDAKVERQKQCGQAQGQRRGACSCWASTSPYSPCGSP